VVEVAGGPRVCPYCAMAIKPEARKCPHCKEILERELVRRRARSGERIERLEEYRQAPANALDMIPSFVLPGIGMILGIIALVQGQTRQGIVMIVIAGILGMIWTVMIELVRR
jgi:predicted nucleic acid-binding Zn ribbon protein